MQRLQHQCWSMNQNSSSCTLNLKCTIDIHCFKHLLNIVNLLCIMTTHDHLHLWVIVNNTHLVEGFNFQQNDAFKLVAHNEYSLPSFAFSICCIQLSYKNLVLGSMLKHWAQWVGTAKLQCNSTMMIEHLNSMNINHKLPYAWYFKIVDCCIGFTIKTQFYFA